MNKQKALGTLLCAATCLAAGSLLADEINCKNGSVFVGEIQSIDGGIATIKNSADDAGETKVKQSEISSIMSSQSLNLRLKSGETLSGALSPAPEAGKLLVGEKMISVEDITSSWLIDGKTPEQREAEKYDYVWSFEVGINVTGTTGNSESISCGANFQTEVKNIENDLKLYVKYNYGKTRDSGAWSKSADDLHAGFDFTSEFAPPWFWYARTDLGFDRTQNIRFLDTSAAGFGLNIIKQDDWNFSIRGGLSYRYENYRDYMGTWDEGDDPDNTNTFGLDIGISHDYSWGWGKIVTEINYVPGFDNFLGNYYIFHETYVQVSVKDFDQMYFRIGIKNEYRSETASDEHLDITYYLQLVFAWE